MAEWRLAGQTQCSAGTAMPAGVVQWGGVYGHNWLIDPRKRIALVALTNTSIEGMAGRFAEELRTAIHGIGHGPGNP